VIHQLVNAIRQRGLEYFGRWYGWYPGEVVDNEDPQRQDRVRVRVDALGLPDGQDVLPNWAYPQTGPWTPGPDKGSSNVPRVGDNVWVCFENGNTSTPRYAPSGWYASGEKPAEFETVEDRGWKTHAGHVVRFRDLDGDESILFRHANGGQVELESDNSIVIKTVAGDIIDIDPQGSVLVQHRAGTKVEMQTTSIDIQASVRATIKAARVVAEASQTELSAPGATHPVVKGDLLFGWLQQLHSWAVGHVHLSAAPTMPTSNSQPPGLPLPPPPAMLSTKTRTG